VQPDAREIVVEDATSRVRMDAHDAVLYRPFFHRLHGFFEESRDAPLHLLVLRRGQAASRVQRAALPVNPDLRLTQVMSSDQAAEADALYMGVFLRIFAVIARRTREIGIRIAIGARPGNCPVFSFCGAF
jgi:hypothetical protein